MLKTVGYVLLAMFALGLVKSCSEEFGLNRRGEGGTTPQTLVECDRVHAGDNRALMACYERLGAFKK